MNGIKFHCLIWLLDKNHCELMLRATEEEEEKKIKKSTSKF